MRTNVDGAAAVVRAAAAAQGRPTRLHLVGDDDRGAGGRDRPRGHDAPRVVHIELRAIEVPRRTARVSALGEEFGLAVVCVNPSSVQGPGRTGGSATLLLDIVNGRLPVLVNTWLSVVDIEDCSAAHVLAERQGVPGRRYLVSGASFEVRTAVALLRQATGHPRRVWFAPRVFAAAGGRSPAPPRGSEARNGRICPETVRTLLHGHRFDASLAERELGLAYTPIETTIRRTLEWYAERGHGSPADRMKLSTRPRPTGGPHEREPDRTGNLAMELARVTEAAALAAGRWIGHGDKIAADGAAVDAMRLMIDTVSMHGTVVIGEGEKDEAPMLFNGEEVGDGDGPGVDVAVDPIDGTQTHRRRPAERRRGDRARRARHDVLPGRSGLHGEGRDRPRGRRRDRRHRPARGERPAGRQGQGRQARRRQRHHPRSPAPQGR